MQTLGACLSHLPCAERKILVGVWCVKSWIYQQRWRSARVMRNIEQTRFPKWYKQHSLRNTQAAPVGSVAETWLSYSEFSIVKAKVSPQAQRDGNYNKNKFFLHLFPSWTSGHKNKWFTVMCPLSTHGCTPKIAWSVTESLLCLSFRIGCSLTAGLYYMRRCNIAACRNWIYDGISLWTS